MKLLLTSNGFVTPKIIAQCQKLVGKPRSKISFAVINEAYAAEHIDHRWLIDDMVRLKDNFGGRIEIVDLLANDQKTVRERIAQADVIFVTGGHTDYLKTVFEKTGFAKMLPELLKTKVYVSISAGSIVMGRRMPTEAYETIYGNRGVYGVTQYLQIVDLSVIPHLNAKGFPGRKLKFIKAAKHQAGVVYGLTDNSAVVVDGDKIYTIGDKPIKFLDGKII